MKRVFILLLAVLISAPAMAQLENGVYTCDEESYQLLKTLSDSRLKNGEILVFTTTHQDLGWLNVIENCIADRDSLWLTPYLEKLKTDPDFKMDIEQTSALAEYVHRHPETQEAFARYMNEGRVCVGASFIQPYEEMYYGEALARQFYFGNKWTRDNFNGYKGRSYFNVDVPGRTLQMPQIMRKAGVDNLLLSRHERGFFNWEAPDGSKVRAYTPGHYIFFYEVLGKSDEEAFKAMAQDAILWYTEYNDKPKAKGAMPAMLNYELSWSQAQVDNCKPLMDKWNSITHIKTGKGKAVKVNLPKFKYAIADEFFEAVDQATVELPTIKGERPNVWLYIHGPSHERALTASRAGDILLPATEKMASFNSIVNGSFSRYPQQRLTEAWEAKIYPDHGWGGNGGILTDNTFQRKYEFALAEASALMDENAAMLASQINTDDSKGTPVVVFNTLSWKRDDPVTVDVSFEPGYASNVAVSNSKGAPVTCQLSDAQYYPDRSIRSAKLHFIAAQIPPFGYATYYIQSASPTVRLAIMRSTDLIETPFYKIELEAGGIKQIRDKELGVNLLNTSKFRGGEVITMQSKGNGAGEFDAVQQPTMEEFDKVSNHTPAWELFEDGDVYTSFKYRSPIRNAVIEQTMTVYHGIKKIDFDVAILNWEGKLYREYRMMFPLGLNNTSVSYEVPYGVLNVGVDEMPGAAGERYQTPNKDQRPRGILNWIQASNDQAEVTLSSSVAVADYIDPTDNPLTRPVLQPILLASRRSCHWQGNEYLQHGDHYYHFSLSSNKPGGRTGQQFGTASNEKLKAVFAPKAYKEASLPEALSFLDIRNDQVIVSALKKSEDDNSLTIRLYNLSDQEISLDPTFHQQPKQIVKTNLIEEEEAPVQRMTLGAYAIETFKLKY